MTADLAFALIRLVSRPGGVLWPTLCRLHRRLFVRCKVCGGRVGERYSWRPGDREWAMTCEPCGRGGDEKDARRPSS